jgi:hypothetical protein
MNITERFEAVGKNFDAAIKRLTYITETTNPLPEDEQLLILSFMELIGASFVSLGEAIEAANVDALEDAVVKAETLYTTINDLINQHPTILALG